MLHKLTSDFPAETKYRRKLAVCYQQLGFIFAFHTRPQEGEKAYEKALSLFSALADEAPSPDDRYSTAEIHEGLATAMSAVGRNLEALSECR